MILGIGVDIVHLQRIRALVARRGSEKLARRILSVKELAEFQSKFTQVHHDHAVMYLGSRWCVKEAVYKALYPVHRLEWKQVSVIKEAGKPGLEIENSAAFGIKKAHVSLSHDGDYAIAQVILES
ncbi:4'-phosphopantetheinyl transferase [Backusella circina FSU 941]|nr:4'-phosphopantetheinyl transferase [Backusella circina FSU 941]